MAVQRHLPNAPIVEALIDFQVKSREGAKVENLKVTSPSFRTRFPEVKEQRLLESFFGLQDGSFGQSHRRNGYMYSSADAVNLVQYRLDGFTFNRLKPYTSWEQVFPQAFALWQEYASLARPEFVKRIAVRYINRLDLPRMVTNLSDYLTVPPTVPPGISGELSGFLTRLNIRQGGDSVALTVALEHNLTPGSMSVILDIDAYRVADFEVDSGELPSAFDQLRRLKNSVFFASITETTAGLFE
jgi:uncharacterized protein (TIGR04255 family)